MKICPLYKDGRTLIKKYIESQTQRVGEEIEQVDSRFEFSAKLYRLCLDFQVPLEEEDNTSIYMLKETNKALHASIQSSEDSIGENTTRFAKMPARYTAAHCAARLTASSSSSRTSAATTRSTRSPVTCGSTISTAPTACSTPRGA